MRRIALACAALFALILPAPAAALNDGLARTPPMGWNGWYAFRCDVNEATIRATIDAMVRSGMRDAGYRYVNLDDCWMATSRGADGALAPDPVRFPHGIRALADYAHSQGFKFGIYLSAGQTTCERRPGSEDNIERDALTVASWGVDLVKLDWCNRQSQAEAREVYGEMRDALREAGRPILLSICEWGRAQPWTWGAQIGHMWRTADDIPNHDHTDRWRAVLRVVAKNSQLADRAGPGGWNDPDILQVGLGGLSASEGRTMFSLWAMMAAPLLAGNDVRRMDGVTRGTLVNRDVIAIDQDPAGLQGIRVVSKGGRDVWVRKLANGERAVLFVNRSRVTRRFYGSLRAMVSDPRARRFRVQDIWRLRGTSVSDGWLTAYVPPHGAAMFRVGVAG